MEIHHEPRISYLESYLIQSCQCLEICKRLPTAWLSKEKRQSCRSPIHNLHNGRKKKKKIINQANPLIIKSINTRCKRVMYVTNVKKFNDISLESFSLYLCYTYVDTQQSVYKENQHLNNTNTTKRQL